MDGRTDLQMDGLTDLRMDRLSYRDVRTHLTRSTDQSACFHLIQLFLSVNSITDVLRLQDETPIFVRAHTWP